MSRSASNRTKKKVSSFGGAIGGGRVSYLKTGLNIASAPKVLGVKDGTSRRELSTGQGEEDGIGRNERTNVHWGAVCHEWDMSSPHGSCKVEKKEEITMSWGGTSTSHDAFLRWGTRACRVKLCSGVKKLRPQAFEGDEERGEKSKAINGCSEGDVVKECMKSAAKPVGMGGKPRNGWFDPKEGLGQLTEWNSRLFKCWLRGRSQFQQKGLPLTESVSSLAGAGWAGKSPLAKGNSKGVFALQRKENKGGKRTEAEC